MEIWRAPYSTKIPPSPPKSFKKNIRRFKSYLFRLAHSNTWQITNDVPWTPNKNGRIPFMILEVKILLLYVQASFRNAHMPSCFSSWTPNKNATKVFLIPSTFQWTQRRPSPDRAGPRFSPLRPVLLVLKSCHRWRAWSDQASTDFSSSQLESYTLHKRNTYLFGTPQEKDSLFCNKHLWRCLFVPPPKNKTSLFFQCLQVFVL